MGMCIWPKSLVRSKSPLVLNVIASFQRLISQLSGAGKQITGIVVDEGLGGRTITIQAPRRNK